MANNIDIFLSYASGDLNRARTLADILEIQGWTVWWDRTIPTGKSFDQVIGEALEAARCVLVLWSRGSVHSHWVIEEAQEGRDRGVLIPVLIDEVKIPLGFRRIQTADLTGWKRDTTDASFRKLLADIESVVGHAPIPASTQSSDEVARDDVQREKADQGQSVFDGEIGQNDSEIVFERQDPPSEAPGTRDAQSGFANPASFSSATWTSDDDHPNEYEDVALDEVDTKAPNPLVDAAIPIFSFVYLLKKIPSQPTPQQLRHILFKAFEGFHERARSLGIPENVVSDANIALYALIRDTLDDTRRDFVDSLMRHDILPTQRDDLGNDNVVFELVDVQLEHSGQNLNFLELFFVCLVFGLQGQHRDMRDGMKLLAQLRERLHDKIHDQHRNGHEELASNAMRAVEKGSQLLRHVPGWILASVLSVLLLTLFSGLTFSLHRDSDPVFLALTNLDVPVVVVPRTPVLAAAEAPPPAPEPQRLSLRILLADEIAAGRLEVVDDLERHTETVVIQGDNLFHSDSDSIDKKFLPLLDIIGEELKKLPGKVLVTAHTDSIPIKTLKFPSNQVLSAKRAENVAERLGEVTGEPTRFTPKGLADSRPRVPEDPTHARNRRVEISLTHPSQAG